MPAELALFTIDIPEHELTDLRARIRATRWPDRETVADWSQGVPLQVMRDLAGYWAENYDWRRFERQMARIPQYLARIDGLDIHFLHIRSSHRDALPLVITHGWPGSFVEFLDILEPLTNPPDSLADSPVGQAAWIFEKLWAWADHSGDVSRYWTVTGFSTTSRSTG